MRPPRITPKGTTYKNQFMEVRHSHADFGDHAKDYYVIHFGRRAGILVLRDDEVLLVRQYRFLVEDLSWELPGGTINEGEDLLVGAARECFEETGVRCRDLQQVVVYYPGLDNVDNRTTIFYTRVFDVEAEFRGNPAEVSEIAWMPFPEVLRMVRQGKILDAMTVVGLTAFQALGPTA
jgi:8-oxo-dGTP pyrophosphatase MutT (NUDIX family)